MISLSEARRIISREVTPLPARRVPLMEAHCQVLAEDASADAFYPSGDRAMMDGYAVRADAVPGIFQLAGEIAAGALPTQALLPGECYRIFTGALLPPECGRVIMQEDATCSGGSVTAGPFRSSTFVRAKGSEAVPGQIILPSGTVLGAAEIAILAQVGIVHPTVKPLPCVSHLATGNELTDPSTVPAPGKIRDTNSSLLHALFRDSGVTDFSSRRVADDPEALAAAAESTADFLIMSGGASVGDYDYGARTLQRLGYTIHFDRVNLRPGKPLTFATRGKQCAFLVPGNPVSHFVCYHTAIKLAVEVAAGLPPSWPVVWLDLDGGPSLISDPRETWWPSRVSAADGRLTVKPLPWSTSGNTFSLTGSNALVLVNSSSPANGKALTLLLETPAS